MKRLFLVLSIVIFISIYVSVYGNGESGIIKENEYPVCKPEQGDPFVPIFYFADVGYQRNTVRNSEQIWKDAKQVEANINAAKGWIEMLEAAVDFNDYYYENCFSPEGNWCRREACIGCPAVDRGTQFKCSPRFKLIGTFQYHTDLSKLLNVNCSSYSQKDKCEEVTGCFWHEEKESRCVSKQPGTPFIPREECEKAYKETGICPKECKMGFLPSEFGSVDRGTYLCIEKYCEDVRDLSCSEYPDKCEWIETTNSKCMNASDCSVYNNNPEQCNRIPVCAMYEYNNNNFCYPREDEFIEWDKFLVYHYYKLFQKLSPSEQQSYSKKFLCNVGKLITLVSGVKTLIVEYDDGYYGIAEAYGMHSRYSKPIPEEFLLGHEIGHNSGLRHYWYSKDSYVGGPGNEGKFDEEILYFLIEDLGTKYYGRSKDWFGRAGKYGYTYKIYNRETTDNDEDKLKSIVYTIEECAKKYSKPYRAGGKGVDGVPVPETFTKENFNRFSGFTDEECKKDEECWKFVQDAISYYKDYLRTLRQGPCNHCVYEECFLGEGVFYHRINYMAYSWCNSERNSEQCRFDRYQIYRRAGETPGGHVLEWLYMSQYPIIHYDGEKYIRYFDLKFRKGTYYKVERIKSIFKELAKMAGISDYKVPVFEEGGENTVNLEVFEFVKDGIYDTLYYQVVRECYEKEDLIDTMLNQWDRIREKSQPRIDCPFASTK